LTSAPDLLRRAIPGKRALKATWSSWRLRRAWRALLAQAPDQDLSPELIRGLIRAWDNEGFAAGREALALLAASVHASRGDILECGCGLSTIVLGALTRGSGRRVYALEHLEEWARPVRRELSGLDFRHVEVIMVPLRKFDTDDTYWWYDIDPALLPPRIDLVFCDGPPGKYARRTRRTLGSRGRQTRFPCSDRAGRRCAGRRAGGHPDLGPAVRRAFPRQRQRFRSAAGVPLTSPQ